MVKKTALEGISRLREEPPSFSNGKLYALYVHQFANACLSLQDYSMGNWFEIVLLHQKILWGVGGQKIVPTQSLQQRKPNMRKATRQALLTVVQNKPGKNEL